MFINSLICVRRRHFVELKSNIGINWRNAALIERFARHDRPPFIEPGWRETERDVRDVRLHVVEAGDTRDPLLILLHGFPEFWWTWRKQITPLAAAGYHVVVPDMRGYNLSIAPQDVSAYVLDVLATDVIALADAYGADRLRFVGHDWGAVIAWWVAARYAGRGCPSRTARRAPETHQGSTDR